MTDTTTPPPSSSTTDEPTERTAAVLRVFAELTSGGGDKVVHDVTAGRHPLVWLGLG